MQKSDAHGGYVMQLQNYSVNDGEGIRTTVFLASCPLRCRWCCNPEGQSTDNDYVRYMKTEELLSHIDRQALFFRHSGGGVTFSGGEATAQLSFLRALTDALYDRGISMTLESCGFFDFEETLPVLKKMELIFLDLKHMDESAHLCLTGAPLSPILENIRRAYAARLPLCIRIPVIAGANAEEENLRASFAFLAKELPGAPLELLPYHALGQGKYEKLGLPAPPAAYKTPDAAQMARIEAWAREYGIRLVSYK